MKLHKTFIYVLLTKSYCFAMNFSSNGIILLDFTVEIDQILAQAHFTSNCLPEKSDSGC